MSAAEYEPQILQLADENGEVSEFEVLDVIEYGGEEYAVLFPLAAADGAVILKILPADGNGDEQLVGVDEDTMNAVFAAFRAAHRDELGE